MLLNQASCYQVLPFESVLVLFTICTALTGPSAPPTGYLAAVLVFSKSHLKPLLFLMHALRTVSSSTGLGLALWSLALISYSRGQYLPVTNTRFVAPSYAIPAKGHTRMLNSDL